MRRVSGNSDTGAADPAVTAALDAWARGAGGEHDALTALAASRLIVPIVAMSPAGGSEGAPPGGHGGTGNSPPRGDGGTGSPPTGPRGEGGTGSPPLRKESRGGRVAPLCEEESRGIAPPEAAQTHMALPTLVGRDGRAAVIAFTGTGTLARWNPEARPVPFPASRVWEHAAAEGSAVVIDVAGPVALTVEGARLAALAAGEKPPPPHEDPDVRAEIAAVTGGFTLEPGPPGSDFLVTLRAADADAARRAAREISVRVRAGGRFRRGVGFRMV